MHAPLKLKRERGVSTFYNHINEEAILKVESSAIWGNQPGQPAPNQFFPLGKSICFGFNFLKNYFDSSKEIIIIWTTHWLPGYRVPIMSQGFDNLREITLDL